MTFLATKAPKSQAQQQPAYTGINIQTSSYGKVIALAYGTTRLAPNLIWYGDCATVSHKSSAQAGKGGSSSTSSVTYTYSTAMAMALCYGPIYGTPTAYVDKGVYPFTSAPNWSKFFGTYPQTPWAYLTAKHPDQAIGYNGIAYLAIPHYSMGSSPNIQNFNFEVNAAFSGTTNGKDADASQVVSDILGNPIHGTGFPALRIADLSIFQAYTVASGLWLSFSLSSQTDAASVLTNIGTATNSEYVWSGGLLNVVPYGDEAITANGQTYTPPSSPLYDLTDDDLVVSSQGADPILQTRKRPADALNSIQMEYEHRENAYATDVVEARDQASIDQYGLQQQTSSTTHLFADGNAARTSVQLQLQRQAIRNQYTFTTDERYILLDPMDIVTLTDPAIDLYRQWVRIIDITENDDRTLTFTAEEYLAGTGSAATYSFATGGGYSTDHNESAGDANAPVIFDAPVQIATTSGLEVWLVASGGPMWGGCDVYVSSDGDTYKLAGERILGSSRQGVLSSALPFGADPDTTHTLSVDLSESRTELLSGTQTDADQANTLCFVDGELIAYETATLTGVATYDLTYLRRGLYGTALTSHAAGSQFARLDAGVFVYSYDKSQIGQTIYVKLLSFNIYQGAQQTLADVEPYTYVIAGPPPPAAVTNFLVAQNGNAVNFTWTQVQDYALKGYDIGYAAQGTTNWTEFNLLTEASKGTEMTNAAVPAGTWTFGIRARDIADQLGTPATFDLAIENNNDTTTIQQQDPDWAGTLTGFIRHWTGVLVPDSTTLANATSDYTIFDTFVVDPVAEASFTTPTYDIGFVNSLRIHSTYLLTPGPGQSGAPTARTQLDSWTSGSDPGTYTDWTVGTVPVRFLNMQILYDPSPGSVSYLEEFTYTVDRSPLIEQTQLETIAVGGSTITFDEPFHDVPYVTPTAVSSSAVYATASSITETDCVINVWDHTGTDVGGQATIRATGI